MLRFRAALLSAFIALPAPALAQYQARDDGWSLTNDGLKLTASASFGEQIGKTGQLRFTCGRDGFDIGVTLLKGALGDADFKKIRSVQAEIKVAQSVYKTSGSLLGESALLGAGPDFDEPAFLRLLKQLYDNQIAAISLTINGGSTIGGLFFLQPRRTEPGAYDASNAFGRLVSMCPLMLPR